MSKNGDRAARVETNDYGVSVVFRRSSVEWVRFGIGHATVKLQSLPEPFKVSGESLDEIKRLFPKWESVR